MNSEKKLLDEIKDENKELFHAGKIDELAKNLFGENAKYFDSAKYQKAKGVDFSKKNETDLMELENFAVFANSCVAELNEDEIKEKLELLFYY